MSKTKVILDLPAVSFESFFVNKSAIMGIVVFVGGKQFAKYTVAHVSHTPTGTPTSQRKHIPGGSHSKPPSHYITNHTPTPGYSSSHTPAGSSNHPPGSATARQGVTSPDLHNDNFLEQSLDASIDTEGGYHGSLQVTPAQLTNPGYKDQSPTHRPNLPYPGGQFYTPPDKHK